VALTGGMRVAPHPHTGLQTVSRLFSGEVEHRDGMGAHALVRPGELNLMTGGFGISHSEFSTADTTVLHGVQLWVALPEAHRAAARDFQHYVPAPVPLPGGLARVFLGALAGVASPAATFTPLLGAEITLEAGASVALDVGGAFEHGLLVDTGEVALEGAVLRPADLGHVPPGTTRLHQSCSADQPARTVLLSGPPFGEDTVMWWNFLGRTHEDVVRTSRRGRRAPTGSGTWTDTAGNAGRRPSCPTPHSRLDAPLPHRRRPADRGLSQPPRLSGLCP
jgi:redox-sensitive bicupin YhaK (pirin superfamily)